MKQKKFSLFLLSNIIKMTVSSSLLLCLLTLVMGLFSSCTENLDFKVTEEPITFDVKDVGFEDGKPVTRGSRTSLIENFGVSASAYNASSTYTSNECGSYFYNIPATPNSAISYFWPAANQEISFFAYHPYGNANLTIQSATTTGAPIYQYTTPTTVASQIDVMTAEVTDMSCETPTVVNLSFKHKCSDLAFNLVNSTSETVTVNSLTIKNFYQTGNLQESTWTTTGSTQDFVLSVNQNVASGSSLDLTGTDNHFFLVPQTIASGKRLLDLYITSGGENKHFYSDLSEAFVAEAGKTYQFKLLLKSNLEIEDEISINDWSLYVGYINYATGTNTENWTPEDQPIEHVISSSITNWTQENN